MKRTIMNLLGVFLTVGLMAQSLSMQQLPLTDLSAFESQAGNWSIVGNVSMNPTVDIHEKPAPPPPSPVKKKRRKKKKDKAVQEMPAVPAPKAVMFQPGTGILLNMNDDKIRDHLLTNWEHGDIILDLEVMIPKGSNSGIYLQGRYEVQLLDSWGVRDPAFSDIGGIYRNWETRPGAIYMGKAPRVNAAKAPGLWQHMQIAFRAPKFDKAGNKTENARFVYVDLNGIRIHENLEVPLPTGGPVEKNEVAKGPIMIQGDHGPVAIRNFQYRHLVEKEVAVTDLAYELHLGQFKQASEVGGGTPYLSGKLDKLTVSMTDPQTTFGMIYTGNLEVDKADRYLLRVNYSGMTEMKVGGKTFFGNWTSGGKGMVIEVDLAAGKNPFTLTYWKPDNWLPSRLGLFNAGSYPVPLHAIGSLPPLSGRANPIYVDPGSRPRLLRAFYDFDGDRDRRLTHTMGIAHPSGVHMIYDLKTATPAAVWRGEFVDATPMWQSRGDGSFRPRGAAENLFAGASIAKLEDDNALFPSLLQEQEGFHNVGYQLDRKSGLPVFRYQWGDSTQIHDHIRLDETGNGWTRIIKVEKAGTALQMKLAEGKEIAALPDGSIVIDKRYYIRPSRPGSVRIRKVADHQEIVATLGKEGLNYTIHW